jgi:hypothetical protein
MIFLANRTNLDTRTLLTRIHNRFQTQVPKADAPVEQVRYQTSPGNKVGVRVTVTPDEFLRTSHPVDEAEIHISFDFPQAHPNDFYLIQWVESDRKLMIGWHQDDSHMHLGECHFQIDYQGETVQRVEAEFLDMHPLHVLDRRLDDVVAVLDALTWDDGDTALPDEAIR